MSIHADPLVVCTLILDSQFQKSHARESVAPTLTHGLKFKVVITWEGPKYHQYERNER